MTINACSALVLLLLLAALYRNLAPKAKQRDNALAVNATSELANIEHESPGVYFDCLCGIIG